MKKEQFMNQIPKSPNAKSPQINQFEEPKFDPKLTLSFTDIEETFEKMK